MDMNISKKDINTLRYHNGAYHDYPLKNLDLNIITGNVKIDILGMAIVYPSKYWNAPEHDHSYFEFHIIPEGKCHVNIMGHNLEVNKGELYVTGPFVKHTQINDEITPAMEYMLSCQIDLSENSQIKNDYTAEENILIKETLMKCKPYIFKDCLGISLQFEKIVKEVKEKNAGFFLKIQALLISLIIDLFRTISSNDAVSNKCKPPEISQDKSRIERIVNYVDYNYKRNISIESISKILYLSPKQINRIMKQNFQQTFYEYLTKRRIQSAKKLLVETTYSMESIALESGFSCYTHMYQAFKRIGLSAPTKFRKP